MDHHKIIWSRRVMFWSALVGLFAASYLLYTYVTGTDLVCGPLHGCDIVRASQWSHWFGIPTPAFGVAFYLSVLFLLVVRSYAPEYKPKLARWAQVMFAVAGFGESLFLTSIQRFVLHSFCFWCLMSAAAASGIFIAMLWDRGVAYGKERAYVELKIVFASLAFALVAGTVGIYILTRPVVRPSVAPVMQQQQPDKILVPNGPKSATSTPDAQPSAPQTPTTTASGPMLIRPWTPFEGPANAKVTLYEFFDFECPGCGLYHKLVIKPLREKYAGRIRFAPRNFPLVELHKNAMATAIAGVCANEQNKFFEFYDTMYANQPNVTRADAENYAQSLGLDMAAFKACEDNPATLTLVLKDRQDGQGFGITGTPTVIINDGLVDGAPNLETMSQLIDERLR